MHTRASATWAAGLAIAACLWSAPARAFELDGHEVIEAAAYKRLLALDVVPGTGVSGRALLASLVATGYLFEPPCFDRAHPRGDCGAAQRLDLPMLYWPTLASGAPDIVINRQLGQEGQCQHFMARTSDGLTPFDPRYDAPGALATTAYSRCVNLTGVVFDGILRDPYRAHERLIGTYALMHAVEDSFSAAHVDRDARFRIVHLLSWTLIDWPTYAWHGNLRFPPSTHHAVTDKRDLDYIRWYERTRDGVACDSFHNPYAFPEECLTARARAARDAVVDLLVVTYQLETSAAALGRRPSLMSPTSPRDAALWMAFLEANLSSVAAPPEMPKETRLALRRPDVFLGAQAIFGPHDVGLGIWGTRFTLGPALPFVLALTGAAAFSRIDGANTLGGSTSLGLLLPLVRRFAIGTAPAAFRVFCDTSFKSCTTDVGATLGVLIVPLGDETWLGVEGPSWSWTTRSVSNTWVGLSFGWSHEHALDPHPPGPEAVADWNPPRVDEVHAFREARSTRAIYVAASAFSRTENQFIGMGIDWRRDRDPWNRRAGLAPELQLEVDEGTIEGGRVDPDRGAIGALAPSLRDYVVPDRLALTATPALVRVGRLGGDAVGVDVAARAGVVLDLGKVELSVDSPPLSYVSRSRWHALPFSLRLGLLLD